MENCNRTKSKMSTKNAPIHIRFIYVQWILYQFSNDSTVSIFYLIEKSPAQSSPVHFLLLINSFYRVYYDDL